MKEHDKHLPRGWALTTVGRVGAIRLGRQRSPKKASGRYPTKYLRLANLGPDGSFDLRDVFEMDFLPEERAIFGLRPGDILIADSSGSATQVGRSALWNGQIPVCCYQNHLIRFRSHAVLPEYAILVFQHYAASGAFAGIARGVGILHLGATHLKEMTFPLPPLVEQKRIAEEAARRLQQLQAADESLRSALIRTHDQDREIIAAAVAGKLVEFKMLVADAPGTLRRDITDDTHDSSKGAGLQLEPRFPDLPAGWRFEAVASIGDIRLGRQRSPKHERGEHLTPYLRAANITLDGLDLSDIFRMNFTPAEQQTFALAVGDIVLAEASGSASQVGRSAVWNGEIPSCCYQNTVIRFRSRASLPSFSLLVFRYYAESGVFAATARGVGIQHLGVDRLGRLGFPVPPIAEQTRIVDEAQSRLAASAVQRESILSAISRLPQLRAEILGAAVSGTLTEQVENDEPAGALLERLGPVPSDVAPYVHSRSLPESTPAEVGETMEHSRRRLADVIRESGRSLTVAEVFAMAGYDRDSTADVETFYLALREEFGRTIHKVRGDQENALLGLIDAS